MRPLVTGEVISISIDMLKIITVNQIVISTFGKYTDIQQILLNHDDKEDIFYCLDFVVSVTVTKLGQMH